MARRKLKHFDEMKAMAHVFEPTLAWQKGEPLQLKGSWALDGGRIILELACGGGDYTVGLAQRFSDATIVGVDIKGSRMWFGARKAVELGLPNAKFLRTKIERLADSFEEGEVDEIWITFPNPHPTEGNAKRRLTSPRFLKMYKKLLKPGGLVHLKTDDAGLYAYTLETLPAEGFTVEVALDDVYGAAERGEAVDAILTEVQTQYEKRYLKLGKAIKYVRAKLFT
ncbi:MAG: tRNA (guanosine(46)-N7)-methyltransferase TrmB [Patescibacteria group bacterium]